MDRDQMADGISGTKACKKYQQDHNNIAHQDTRLKKARPSYQARKLRTLCDPRLTPEEVAFIGFLFGERDIKQVS
jgi:hypothetical protein